MTEGTADVTNNIVDKVWMSESGIGPVGCAAIVIFLLLYIIMWYHVKAIIGFYTGEITRIASERDKWENRLYEGQLKSSKDKVYEKPPELSKDKKSQKNDKKQGK